jgi:hypothetical protein
MGQRPLDEMHAVHLRPSRLTLPIGTATASSQRSPVKASTITTSPRSGLNRSKGIGPPENLRDAGDDDPAPNRSTPASPQFAPGWPG